MLSVTDFFSNVEKHSICDSEKNKTNIFLTLYYEPKGACKIHPDKAPTFNVVSGEFDVCLLPTRNQTENL